MERSMKRIVILLLAASACLVQAQTNAPAHAATNAPALKVPDQEVVVTSDHGRFDGIKRQMIYVGHVFVTDAKSEMRCGQLTVDLPADGGHPTNMVAVTNVVIDALDEKGQTNHITADKAVYAYHVINTVTNETITFTGGDPMPKVDNPQFIIYGEPLVLNLTTRQFSASNEKMIFKATPKSDKGTNSSPFNLLK